MSWEGYNQYLCANGHYFTAPAGMHHDNDDIACPECDTPVAWHNVVDDTNGDSHGHVYDFDVDAPPVVHECQACHTTHTVHIGTFKIPTPEETRARRTHRPDYDDRVEYIASGLTRQQERSSMSTPEQLRQALVDACQWIHLRIQTNIDEHGECCNCWMQPGENSDCAVCRQTAQARAFLDRITTPLKDNPEPTAAAAEPSAYHAKIRDIAKKLINELERHDYDVSAVRELIIDLGDASLTCAHEPDFDSAHIESDGGEWYLDVTCQHCGLGGCIGSLETLAKHASWE